MVQCFLLTKYNHCHCHDTSWNNFRVLHPILIQRTTFFSFFCLLRFDHQSDMCNVYNGYMVAHLPFTSSGCLQALINLKSMIQHPRCNCITIRFTVGASEEALLHVTACRQHLAIHNHLQQGLLSCNNLRKSSFKHLPLVANCLRYFGLQIESLTLCLYYSISLQYISWIIFGIGHWGDWWSGMMLLRNCRVGSLKLNRRSMRLNWWVFGVGGVHVPWAGFAVERGVNLPGPASQHCSGRDVHVQAILGCICKVLCTLVTPFCRPGGVGGRKRNSIAKAC